MNTYAERTQLDKDIHTASIEMLGHGEIRKQRMARRFMTASKRYQLMDAIEEALAE